MERKEFLILLVTGGLLIVDVNTFPPFPSFGLVAAYILTRYYHDYAHLGERLGSRIALSLFLAFYLSLNFIINPAILCFVFLIFIIPVGAGFLICFLIIIYSFLELKKRFILLTGILLCPIITISLLISLSEEPDSLTLRIISISILTGVIIISALYRLLVLEEKKICKNDIIKKNFKTTDIKTKVKKERLFTLTIYYVGGLILVGVICGLIILPRIITYGADYVLSLIVLSVWGATLLALSSKHNLADVGYIIFGGITIPFFFIFSIIYSLPLGSMLVIIRVLLGISFTLILLGYDLRRIPREGLIEYSIYGLSFIPLVSSLIFVTPYIDHPYIALIFVLSVLIKIILTAGYVYKRVGVV